MQFLTLLGFPFIFLGFIAKPIVLALAVATQREPRAQHALSALASALAIVQAQATARVPAPDTWLLTAGAVRSDCVRTPAHAGSWGLARSARTEAQLALRCLDGALVDPAVLPAEPELVLHETLGGAGGVR